MNKYRYFVGIDTSVRFDTQYWNRKYCFDITDTARPLQLLSNEKTRSKTP